MPFQVKCPSCSKVLKASRSMAGKRAKCPECFRVLRLPAADSEESLTDSATSSKLNVDLSDVATDRELMNLLAASEFRKAASLFKDFQFYLVSLDANDDPPDPLIAEVREGEAVLAFTSKKFLSKFAEIKLKDVEFGKPKSFKAAGKEVFRWLVGDTCLLINAESKSALLLDPECILEVQEHFQESEISSAVNDIAR